MVVSEANYIYSPNALKRLKNNYNSSSHSYNFCTFYFALLLHPLENRKDHE